MFGARGRLVSRFCPLTAPRQELRRAGGRAGSLVFPHSCALAHRRTALRFGFGDCPTVGEIGLK